MVNKYLRIIASSGFVLLLVFYFLGVTWWIITSCVLLCCFVLPTIVYDNANSARPLFGRISRIEKRLSLLAQSCHPPDDVSRKVAYRVILTLMPHWKEILSEDAKRQGKEYKQLMEEIKNSDEHNKDKSHCLIGKEFNFNIFRDEHTGLYQVWSFHEKCFVNEARVSTGIIEDFPFSLDVTKWEDSCLGRYVEFNERGADIWHYGDAKIPYQRIKSFLLALAKYNSQGCWYLIKKFPKELEEELKENNVTYDGDPLSYKEELCSDDPISAEVHCLNDDKWFKYHGIELYNQSVNCHCFHTPFYSIRIDLSVFHPPSKNRYPMPEDDESK